VAQKRHFAILQIEVTRASRGHSAIAELRVLLTFTYLLPSRIWTRCVSRQEVVGDQTWV